MNHDKNHKKAVRLPSETVEKTASVLVAIGKGAYKTGKFLLNEGAEALNQYNEKLRDELEDMKKNKR